MIGILFALLLVSPAHTLEEIPDVEMHVMTKEILVLQRYMFSESAFMDAKNEQAIRNAFPVLEKHLKRLKEQVFTKEPFLRTTTSMLAEQVSDADEAFRENQKHYARYVLVSSLQMCIACHTRTASSDFVLPEEELKGASMLEKANYYFATRQFDKGRDLYEQVLKEMEGDESTSRVRSVALALAIYYARVKEDPEKGRRFFSNLAKGKQFTKEQREEFREWALSFERWPKGKPSYIEPISDAEAIKLARRLLREKSGAPANEIRQLRASSQLHSVLEAPGGPSPIKAEALLRLGKIYASLDFPLYYRFGDMYLKACIMEYKQTKEAQDCYKALEQVVKSRIGQGSQNGAANMEEVELFRWKKIAY